MRSDPLKATVTQIIDRSNDFAGHPGKLSRVTGREMILGFARRIAPNA
jgi:hypothetical protein